ncbi:tripartite tricarboxylate transporter permease [Devosia sp. A369]
MDVLSNLAHGFSVALQPGTLLMALVGCFLGTLVGILPGLGPAATIALLLPLTIGMDPASALIMFAGVYYGAQYGGAITAILLNVPGDAAATVTLLDGHPMAREGRAGAALGIAALSSFVGGTIAVVLLTLIAPPLAELALRMGPPEYFAIMFVGLSLVVALSGEVVLKGLISLLLGLWLASVGIDILAAQPRFTLGLPQLLGGLDFTVVAVGVFAIASVLESIGAPRQDKVFYAPNSLRRLFPTTREIKDCLVAWVNGSCLGFLLGILPGAGATIASFISYGVQRKISRQPERFGKGAPDGVAAPEAANNAAATGALLPLLSFGIPGSGTTAIMLSGLLMWGFRPGPMLMVDAPDLFWGLVASMYIGNVVLLIMNLPMIPIFAQVLRVPKFALYPFIFGLSMVATFAVSERVFDVVLMVVFGFAGYLIVRQKFPLAPLILGFVLGPMMERSLRQTLQMNQNDLAVLFYRPISAVLVTLGILVICAPVLGSILKHRKRAQT